MRKLMMVLAATVACSGMAQANDNPLYFGAMYDKQSVDVIGASFDFGLITGVVGYDISDYLSVEGRLGFGVIDEDIRDEDGENTVGVDHSYSVLLKAGTNLSDSFRLYGLAGYNKTKYGANDGDISEGGLTYGIGGEMKLADNFSLNLEYAKLPDISDEEVEVDVDRLSLGVTFRF